MHDKHMPYSNACYWDETDKTVNMLEGKYQVGALHSPAGEVQSGCLITFTVRIIGTFTGTSTASFKTLPVMGHY